MLALDSPPAIVSILLFELLSVNDPVPFRLIEDAVKPTVWVTAPVACKFIVLLVAVNAALIAKAPP